MSSVLEIACLLGDGPGAGEAVALLSSLAFLLDEQASGDAQSAADELDSVLFELTPALLRCTALSPAAEQQVRRILAAAAERCTAREVFTLGMAALGEQLSAHDSESPPPAHGPASPGFQLFLLCTLCRCLPRIRRRPLHFAAELLHMQLRWAAEVLPALPLGDPRAAAAAAAAVAAGPPESSTAGTADPSQGGAAADAPGTVAGTVASLASLAAHMAAWLQQQQGSDASQLSAAEQQAAAALLGMTLLQLAALTLQLPAVLQAAEVAVAAAAQAQPGGTSSIGAAPTAGGRLPAMRAAANELLLLPRLLLQQVPGSAFGQGSSSESSGSSMCSGEGLQQLAAAAHDQLASSGLDPEDLSHFSALEAEEGAAAAVCAEALDPHTPPQQQAAALQPALSLASQQLLDLGAQHKSVALSLLPLGALCTACSAVSRSAGTAGADGPGSSSRSSGGGCGSSGIDCRLTAGTPALSALLSTLVAIMAHNPVQLVRSCAHDALQALLDAFAPPARLEQLRALVQMPSTAAAVVALQRLRQEMAAAWPVLATQQQDQLPQGAAGAGSSRSGGSSAGESQLWLSEAALGLALPCLEHGSEAGWHDEGSVLRQADVQAAALSLLRWVLLREAAAPRGLLPRPAAERLLQRDLLPLQACVLRLLSAQRSAMEEGGGAAGLGDSNNISAAAALEQQQLDSYLAVQRLHEALKCVIELI
ncbi:hypothetical protein COHA_009348 [Chlorella ohadii]|uniref:Uncharacterized protein n=1 Tax=Chlorella ohadii TaxID=2649997 RepID=A0AAD5DI69_9CHLO|nr:hypothetical protein COHA_009348 [Chlorella ohadii]